MKVRFYSLTNVFGLVLIGCLFLSSAVFGQREMENLGRGVVALRTVSGGEEVLISWRYLVTDPEDIAFNVYRDMEKINDEPLTVTNAIDNTMLDAVYTVVPVIDGEEQPYTSGVSPWENNYLTIPLQRPTGSTTPDNVNYSYSPNDASVGDLDGDGEYEIIVKWDPSNAKDNSQAGYTGNVYLDAYELDGTHLWRIDLGRNIRAGAHYTQFMVYDLDSDGKAEIAIKTAPNTKDGLGEFISKGPAANDNDEADYRNSSGKTLTGPEYLTIFDGATGAELATTNYLPARHPSTTDPTPGQMDQVWGDDYGNRIDRFLAGVAYFDGEKPSLLMARGYYTRTVLVAWDWRNGELTERWIFDSNDTGNGAYAGQGYHSLTIADLDQDGKDEVFYGSMAVDDDGTGLWNTRLGHGDAMHVTDLDPSRPGLESWTAHECEPCYDSNGLWFRDAATGEKLWGVPTTGDIGRSMAADIDPNYAGYEVWGQRGGLYSAKGELISSQRPGSMNFGIWWDGDLLRELLDGRDDERYGAVYKWDPSSSSQTPLLNGAINNVLTNNGTKATPALSADILGDWREEVLFRTADNSNLILFHTPKVTEHRIFSLMQDPQYRLGVAWQNVAYNQPPYPSFFLGAGMETPEKPEIVLVGEGTELLPPPFLAATNVAREQLSKINVYPNPSTGVFFIKAEGLFKYNVYDQLGKVLESGSAINDIAIGKKLSAGMYILKIETGKITKTSWIIKN